MFAIFLKEVISNQESISSKIMNFGFNNLSCNISSFFLSHPLNQTFKSLQRKSLFIFNSSNKGNICLLKCIKPNFLSQAELYIFLKNSNNLTQGISGILWKAKKIHNLDLLSGDNHLMSFQSNNISPSVTL
jgi:uncharacterized membrane protein